MNANFAKTDLNVHKIWHSNLMLSHTLSLSLTHIHTHKEAATRQYCATVEELVSADMGASSGSANTDPSSSGGGSYQDIVVSDSGGARTILLNRPHKYNAITLQVNIHFCDPLCTVREGKEKR